MSIELKRIFNAALLDGGTARVESETLELNDDSVVTVNITTTDQGSFAGTLRIEVANGSRAERERERETGGDLLPWQLYGPVGSTVSTVTITNDVITLSSSQAIAIKIQPGFKWVRFVAARTAGAGAIDGMAGVTR